MKLEILSKLEEKTLRYAADFDTQLQQVEDIAISVEVVVESLLALDQLDTPNYIDEFELLIEPVIKQTAELGDKTQSAYVFFSPELDGHAHDVWFTDLNGDGEVTRQEEFPLSFYDDYDEGEEWYFVPKFTSEPYWTGVYDGNVEFDSHITYLSHTRPIIVGDVFVGVAGSDYHYEKMETEIASLSFGENSYAFLQDENGYVLIHPNLKGGNLVSYGDGEYKWLGQRMINESYGFADYTWVDGEEKLLVFKRLNNGWVFGITLSTDDAFKWLQDALMLIIVIVIVAVVITSILGYQIGYLITKPLTEITEYVKVIGDGDYSTEIPDYMQSRGDETGLLSRSIEVMRKLQKESFDQIIAHNETLEHEIAKRTKSLIESNNQLEVSLNENKVKTEALLALNVQLEEAIEHMEETQYQLIESEKIASLSFLVNRLAHEFNTPIGNFTTLLSYLDTQKEIIQAKLDKGTLKKDDLYSFLEKMNDSYEMLIDNLNKMQQLVLRFKELDPSSHMTIQSNIVVKDYIDIVIDSLHINDPNVVIEVLCDPEYSVNVDAGKLSQIILHLIENAVRHAFKRVNGGMIVIDVSGDQSVMTIIIKDNGIGMDESVQEHIFVPFYSSSFTDEYNGLGLNIVYNIVTKVFGGEIICNSTIGEGTEFIITLNL
jgi:signal transduction histidine kinase